MKVKKFISLLTAMISFYNLGLSKNAEYLETHAVQLTKTSDKSDVSTGKELYDSLPKNNNPFYLNNHYTIKNDEDEPKLIIYGDLVEDMCLDSKDLSVLRRYVTNKTTYDKKADLDGDNDVDEDDVNLLKNYILGNECSFPIYAEYDSDMDGINDYLEMEYFKTKSREADTDGDGLTDYEEVVFTYTDPKNAESVTKGVSDADIDYDDDGISNIEELKLGCSPSSTDSDMDGLNDGYEVKTLKTEPNKADTDGDGLSDSEEIELGLDPLNISTNGTPDGERIIKQIIPADDPIFRDINTSDNAYTLSIVIEASGYAKNCLTVRESSYSYVLQDSAAIGLTPEFLYNENYKVESITLNFEIKEAFRDNVSHYFDYMGENDDYYDYTYQINEELDGIKRLNVFKFFESISLPMPICTDYDVDNNIVSVTIDTFETDDNGNSYGIGSYSLVDLEVWGKIMNESEEEEIYESDTVEYTQRFRQPAPNIQEGTKYITKALKKLDDTLFEFISRGYQSYNARQAEKKGENLKTGSASVASLFGHRYAYYEAPGISWSEAVTACQAKGGHLITVTSPFEYSFLSGTLSAGKSGLYWTGASGTPYNWSWLTGESTKYVRTISAYGYTMDTCGTYFSGLGNHLAYCPGLAYSVRSIPNVSQINGYICEWEPNAPINDSDSGLYSMRIGGSAIAIINGVLAASSTIDSDKDGIPDWKEINQAAIVKLGGTTADLAVAWKNAQQYVNSTKKLAGNEIEKLSKKITSVFDGNKSVTPVSTNPACDDSDGDGYKDDKDPRPNVNDIKVTKISQDYIAIDYSTSDPSERNPDREWINHNDPQGTERQISYGGDQGWFEYLKNDCPDNDKLQLIANQGCGLIAMADIALYLSRRDPSTFNNNTTNIASVANPIDFNKYKKYLLTFEEKYVNLHVPSVDFSVNIPISAIGAGGLGVGNVTLDYSINYGDWMGINSNDGNMGKILTKYFEDNNVNLKASWCILDDSLTKRNIWAKRIKELISRDIPAIIAIGPSYGDEEIKFYDRIAGSIDKLSVYEENTTVDNHYFNVTAVIEDKVKMDNNYWNGVMYEVSSWGQKYYMSEKEMDEFIHEHYSLFTNVVYIEDK